MSSPQPSDAPMHVLVVAGEYNSPTDNVSGAFIQPQLRALAEMGCKVGVVYPELRGATQVGLTDWRRFLFPMWHRSVEGVQEMGIEGFSIPKSTTLSRKLWDRQAVRLGCAYVQRHGRPDIVHAHFSFVAGPAASELARRFSAPLVVTEHYTGFLVGTVTPFDSHRTAETLAHSAAVLAVGEPLSNAIQRFAQQSVRVLPNVVHIDFFTTSLHRQSETTFNLLTVGGLRSAKGLDILLRAFHAAFPDAHDSVRLRICGEGEERQNLESLICTLGLKDRVRARRCVQPSPNLQGSGGMPRFCQLELGRNVRRQRDRGLGCGPSCRCHAKRRAGVQCDGRQWLIVSARRC